MQKNIFYIQLSQLPINQRIINILYSFLQHVQKSLNSQSRKFGYTYNKLLLEIYVDADYVGSLVNKKSTTNYYTFLRCNLIIWRSKKENVITRLSTKLEFKQWLKWYVNYYDLKIKLDSLMCVYCDNKLAINIVHNLIQYNRTKHIKVDRHFTKVKPDNGLICIHTCLSAHSL